MKAGKAAVFVGANKDFEVREYPVSKPPAGQALLKMRLSGVCGTDVHIHHGRLGMPTPLILGHEFVGEIEAINGKGFEVGDKVILNAATPCGECLLCKNGDSANCLNFKVAFAQNPEEEPHFFGGFAEYSYANIDNLVKIPKEVDYRAAAVYPCAGPTIIHSLKLGGIFQSKGENINTAVIQGAGPVGMFAVIWALKAGIKNVILSYRASGKRAELAKKLGVEHIVSPDKAEEYVQKITGKVGADLVIECSGNPKAFLQGTKMLRNRGIYLVPGQYSDSGDISFGPQIITFKALQVIGSSQYDTSDIIDYIEFLRENADIQKIIANSIKEFKVEEINEAIAYAGAKSACKVVLSSGE